MKELQLTWLLDGTAGGDKSWKSVLL